MSAYEQVKFLTSANRTAQLPPDDGVEVAVSGRSNAGKSSAINVITGRKGLARTSKAPGATRLLNFFELRTGRRLVDLPGYGYAKAPESERSQWDTLVGGYVARRQSLVGIVIVMDARRPLLPADEALIAFIDRPTCKLHFLLTKADQLNNSEKRLAIDRARRRAEELGPWASAQLFSALKRQGVEELETTLTRWLRD